VDSYIAERLLPGGRLVTIEADARRAEVARATAIQTVSAKGYDGLALALVGAASRSRSR
jgi:hypothetical protein